ncbi:class I SAM-dependent methyltransferase [Nocardioides panacisoli]|uniref:class I SAM-dependent methyltransferase n=1 Tax=Nocardioides panacisoli TaxID=627624 RepID=UPI001C630E94|nr:class I SAM-dependent methyltransferase [Nocardioides panacisoli]QYJ03331.1 class I SAM-dependent methyltransferase [Nocardioides panacisoli]
MTPRDEASDDLLAEQRAYYDALAAHYLDGAIPGSEQAGDELVAAIDAFAPAGDVLELACGPGTWTPHLLRHASTVTAVDSSPRMLELAASVPGTTAVRFQRDDLFTWRPDRRYDVVFFGFWLSHVPRERFADFWSRVADALVPGGRVLFVDDAYRTPDELVQGEESTTIRRRLRDGTAYRAVKVPHEPAALSRQLADLGWDVRVEQTNGPFYWGAGRRADR